MEMGEKGLSFRQNASFNRFPICFPHLFQLLGLCRGLSIESQMRSDEIAVIWFMGMIGAHIQFNRLPVPPSIKFPPRTYLNFACGATFNLYKLNICLTKTYQAFPRKRGASDELISLLCRMLSFVNFLLIPWPLSILSMLPGLQCRSNHNEQCDAATCKRVTCGPTAEIKRSSNFQISLLCRILRISHVLPKRNSFQRKLSTKKR